MHSFLAASRIWTHTASKSLNYGILSSLFPRQSKLSTSLVDILNKRTVVWYSVRSRQRENKRTTATQSDLVESWKEGGLWRREEGEMKVVSIAVLRYNHDTADPVMLSQVNDLSSFGFFQRQGIKEMCTFFSKTIVKRTQPGMRQSVQHEDYNVHVYMRQDGLAGTVTADLEYPPRVAFVLLTQLLDQYAEQVQWQTEIRHEAIRYEPMEKMIVDYQDPAKADKITKIQRDLDETTEVLHRTIDNVLERGVRLDELVDRSDDLSRQSKMFYKQARKTNSCCVIS